MSLQLLKPGSVSLSIGIENLNWCERHLHAVDHLSIRNRSIRQQYSAFHFGSQVLDPSLLLARCGPFLTWKKFPRRYSSVARTVVSRTPHPQQNCVIYIFVHKALVFVALNEIIATLLARHVPQATRNKEKGGFFHATTTL